MKGTFACFSEIISKSPKIENILKIIEKLSNTSSSVLITGESGTGKELFAKAIQSCSSRNTKPFITVNCGAIPSELMESEFFGFEKGSFTGACTRKIGKFEVADGGTLFLDEIATLPIELQVKLLRVLQEKTFERIGSNIPIKVDIRIIAATNVNLEKEVAAGRFREDLYYRLNVVPINIPPLRERQEDIPLLIEYFSRKFLRNFNKTIKGITPDFINGLSQYSWPGNVRELENFMERFIVLTDENGTITLDDLPKDIFPIKCHEQTQNFREAIKTFEKNFILEVLIKHKWNILAAARAMKIHRNTLFLKIKAHNLTKLK